VQDRRLPVVAPRDRDFLEIDWRHERPVATTNRYGIGYLCRSLGELVPVNVAHLPSTEKAA
jgi:hypothetical protein